MSSIQKWCNLGLASLNPNYTTSVSAFQQPLINHLRALFCYIFRFSRLAFRAWGSAPLLIVSHSFNIKFNRSIKQKK